MSELDNSGCHVFDEEEGVRGWYYRNEASVSGYLGPHATLELALQQCEDQTKPIQLIKCYNPSIKISDCIDTDEIVDLLYNAKCKATDLYGDAGNLYGDDNKNAFNNFSEEQKANLLTLIRKAFDEWQVKESITVNSGFLEIESRATVFPDGTIEVVEVEAETE